MSNQFEQTVQSIEQALKRLIDLAQETDDKLEQIQDVRLNIARDLTESNNQLERFDKILESLGVKGLKKVRQAVQMVNEAIAGINVSSLDELNTALERNNRLLSSIESLSNRARNNVNNIIAPILTATNQVDDLITKIDQLGPSGQRAVSEIQSALNSLNVNQAVAGIDSLQVSLNNLRTDNVAHLAASVTALQTSINSIDVDKLIKLTNVQAPAAKAVIEEVASETSQKKPQKPRVKKEKTASGLSLEEVKKRAADRLVEEPIPQTRTLEEVVSERKEAEDSRRLAYSIRRMIASAFVKERSTSIGADLSEDKINVIARKIAEGVVSREQGEGADSIGAFSEQFEVVIKDLERAYAQDNQKKIQALKKKYKIPDTSIGAASAIFETAPDFQPSKVGEYSKRAEELRKEEDKLRGGSDVQAKLSVNKAIKDAAKEAGQSANETGTVQPIRGIFSTLRDTLSNLGNVGGITDRVTKASDAINTALDSLRKIDLSGISTDNIEKYATQISEAIDTLYNINRKLAKASADINPNIAERFNVFSDVASAFKNSIDAVILAIRTKFAELNDALRTVGTYTAEDLAGIARTLLITAGVVKRNTRYEDEEGKQEKEPWRPKEELESGKVRPENISQRGKFFRSHGDTVLGANPDEYLTNLEVMRQAIEASPHKMAVFGTVGGPDTGRTPGINLPSEEGSKERVHVDHSFVAYEENGRIKLLEVIAIPGGPGVDRYGNPTEAGGITTGLRQIGARTPEELSQYAGELIGVPLEMPQEAFDRFAAQLAKAQLPGQSYSFITTLDSSTEDNIGNSCASGVAEALRKSGTSDYGAPLLGKVNLSSPAGVLRAVAEINKDSSVKPLTHDEKIEEYKNLQSVVAKYLDRLQDTAFYEGKQRELNDLNAILDDYYTKLHAGEITADEAWAGGLHKQQYALGQYVREPENIQNALPMMIKRIESLGAELGDSTLDPMKFAEVLGGIVTGNEDMNNAIRSAYTEITEGGRDSLEHAVTRLSQNLSDYDPTGNVPNLLQDMVNGFKTSNDDVVRALLRVERALDSYNLERLKSDYVNEPESLEGAALGQQAGELFARLSPAGQNNGPMGGIMRTYRSFSYASSQIGAILNSVNEFAKYIKNINPGTFLDVIPSLVKFTGATQNLSSRYLGIGSGANQRRGQTIVDLADAARIMWNRSSKEQKQYIQPVNDSTVSDSERQKAARDALNIVALTLKDGKPRFRSPRGDRDTAIQEIEGVLASNRNVTVDELKKLWAGNKAPVDVDLDRMRDLLNETYRSFIQAAESVKDAGDSAHEASESNINASLSPNFSKSSSANKADQYVRSLLQQLPEKDLQSVKQVESAIKQLSGSLGKRTGAGYVIASDEGIRQILKKTTTKDQFEAYDKYLREGRLQGANVVGGQDLHGNIAQIPFSVRSHAGSRDNAGQTILHELTHGIINDFVNKAKNSRGADATLDKTLMDSFAGATHATKLIRSPELTQKGFAQDLDYYFDPNEVLAHVGEAFLSGNEQLETFLKDMYGEDLWNNAIAQLNAIAPDVFGSGAEEIQRGFKNFDNRIKQIIEDGGEQNTIIDVIKAFVSNTMQNIKTAFDNLASHVPSLNIPQELEQEVIQVERGAIPQLTARLSQGTKNSATDTAEDLVRVALNSFSSTGSKLQGLQLSAALNKDIQNAVLDLIQKPTIESLDNLKQVGVGFLSDEIIGQPSAVNQALSKIPPIKEAYTQGLSFNAGRVLAERTGMQPNIENQYFDDFNKAFRKRTGESLQRKDFTIQETFDWETGTTKLAASAKSASGAVTQLSAEIDQLGNVSVDVPKSGFGEAMDRIRSEIVQEIPEEIIEEFIFGIISAAQELFSAILNLQDEIAEVEILMEDARGNDLTIDTGKLASDFTISAIEMAAVTGQGFEEALKTNIQNFKVLANVKPVETQTQIAQQLSQTQLGSQTVFGLSLDQSLESLPAIYAQMRDMIKDTDMSAAERAQQAADGLDALMDKFVVARRETGAAGDELVQIYARLASSASDIGLDPDKLIALSASASVALGKSADETANSLKFFIERTYSQEGIKALNDYGIAVQRIGDDGVPVMRSLDDIIDDINSKLEKSPNLAKGIAQELGGRARAGEVSAIIGSRSIAERTETALKTDVQGDEFEKDIERKAARFVGSMNTLKANLGLFVQGTLFQSGILDEFGSALVKISEKFKAVAGVFINNQDTVESWQPIIVGIAQAFLFMAINAGKAVTGLIANLSKVGLSARNAVTGLMNMFDKPSEHLAQRAASAGLAVIDEFNRMGASSADLGSDFEKMAQRAGASFGQIKQDAQEMVRSLTNAQAPTAYTGDTLKLNPAQTGVQPSLAVPQIPRQSDDEEQRILRILNNTASADDIRRHNLTARMDQEAPTARTYSSSAEPGMDDYRFAMDLNNLGDTMNDYASIQREVQNETKQATMESVVATREETRSKKESSRASRDVAKESKGTSSGLKAMGSFLRGFTTRGVTGVPTFLQNNERLRSGLSTVGDIAPMAAMDLMIGGFGGENVTNIGAGIAGAFAGSLMGPMGTMIGYQIGQGTAEMLDLYGQIGTSKSEKESVAAALIKGPQTIEEKAQITDIETRTASDFIKRYNVDEVLAPYRDRNDAGFVASMGLAGGPNANVSSAEIRRYMDMMDAGETPETSLFRLPGSEAFAPKVKEAYDTLSQNRELLELYASADLSSLADIPKLLREAADPTTELGRQFLLVENQTQAAAENINQVKVNAEEFARLSEVASSGGDVELFAPDIRGVYDVLADNQDLLDSFVAGGFESIQQALNDTTEAGKEFKRLWEDREQEELYFGSLAQTLSEIDEKIASTRSSMQTMFSMPTGLGEFGAFGTQTLGLRNQYLPEVTQIASQPYASEDDQRTLESYQMGRESLMGLGEMESYMLPLAQELNQDLEGMRQILYEVGAEGQQAFASSIQPLIEMIQFTREYEAQLAAIKAIENDPSFAPGMEGYQEAAAKLAILKEETLERKSQYEYYRAYLDSVASSPEAFKKELESVQKITRARQVTQAQPTVIKGREAQFRAPSLVDVEGYSTEEIAQALEEARKKQEDMVRMFPQMAEEFRKEQFMLEAGDQYQGVTGVSQSYFQESLSGIREEREKKPEPLQAPGNVDLSDYSDEEIQKIMAEARALQDQAVALAPDLADKYEDERLLVLKKNNQLLLETGLSQEYLQAALEDNTEATEEGLRGHYNLPGGYKPPTIWDYYNEGGTSTGDVNYVPPPGSEGGVSMDMATNIANAILEAEANKGKEIDEDVMPTLAGLDTMTPGAAPLGYPDPGTPDKVIPAPVVEVPEIETIDLPEYPMQEAEEQKSIIQRLSDKFLAMLPVTEVQESITARLSQRFTDMVSEAQILASTTNTTSTNVSDMGTKSANTSSSLVDLFGRTKDAGLSVTSMAQAAASVNSVMSDSAVAMRDLPPAASDTTSSFNAVGNAMDTLAKQIARVNIAQQLADVINKGAITVNISVTDNKAAVTATAGSRGATGSGGSSTKAGSTTGKRPI